MQGTFIKPTRMTLCRPDKRRIIASLNREGKSPMSEDNSMRLAKRMVELGMCSRREADDYIEQGRVKVDGEIVRILGSRVRPEQHIELVGQDRPLDAGPATLLLYRDTDDDTDWHAQVREDNRSSDDRSDRSLLARHLRRQTAFGATDPHCTGLVVLSQDRRLHSRLADCEQEFLVSVAKAPAAALLVEAAREVEARSCRLSRQSDHQLRILLTAPQPNAIAAVCAKLNCPPLAIRCIRIGRLQLGRLEAGRWRFLLPTDRF
jgi:23S rRNA pseudouridine2604 synthase